MTERQKKKIKNNGLMPNVVEQETSIITPVNCKINKKSEHNKQFFRTVSKTYKCAILQCIRKTKEDRIKKIKTLKNSNSKEYWKYLNSDTENPSCQVHINELHDFFKDINSSPHANQSEVYDNCNMQNSDINEPINDEEIRKAFAQWQIFWDRQY